MALTFATKRGISLTFSNVNHAILPSSRVTAPPHIDLTYQNISTPPYRGYHGTGLISRICWPARDPHFQFKGIDEDELL